MASAVPVSGSTYSYAYATLGEVVAMGVAACLLLEYGVSTAAVAVGWSGYLNQLLHNLFGWQIPNALSAAPWDTDPGIINLPALFLVAMCALLLIRGASESAKVNATMVVIKLAVLLMFVAIAFTGFHADNFADFAPKGVAGHHGRRRHDLLHVHRPRRRLDRRRRGARPAEDDAARHPRRPRASSRRSTSWSPSPRWAPSRGRRSPTPEQGEAGLAKILQDVVGASWPGTILSAGAVISIFSVTLVTMYGQTRILFAIGRDGLLPRAFARVNPRTHTPVNNTVIVAIVVGLLAAFIPLDYLWDLVSIGTLDRVHRRVGRRRHPAPHPARPAARVQGPRLPGHARCSPIAACLYILSGLHWYTYAWFLLWLAVVLAFYFLWGRKHSLLAAGDRGGPASQDEDLR